MADFRLALGANIDVCTPAEIDEKLSGLQGHLLSRLERREQRPIRRTSSGSIVLNLTTGQTQVGELANGRPPMGKIWQLCSLTILGSDDHSSINNLVVATYGGDPATPMLGQCIIPGQPVPYFNTPSRHSIWLHDTEELFLNFTASGTITNQVVVYNAKFNEWRDTSMEAQSA